MNKDVYFRNFNEAEFTEYMEKNLYDYFYELKVSKRFKNDEEIFNELKRYKELFTDGVHTKDFFLYKIVNQDNVDIGYIWYKKVSNDTVYICEYLIFDNYRNSGYGFLTIKKLEDLLIKEKIRNISLHVFSRNEIAIKLYNKLGFIVTGEEIGGILMNKTLY